MRQELEYVDGRHSDRVLRHDGEERLQIERHRPQRVGPCPASNELQIAVHQWMAKPIPRLA